VHSKIERVYQDDRAARESWTWPGVSIAEGDVAEVTERVWTSVGAAPFGWHGLVTKEDVAAILAQVIIP
jgi:hypothetical protein